jgi:hypothetical protein
MLQQYYIKLAHRPLCIVVESAWLLGGAGATLGPGRPDLGFLGLRPYGNENPWFLGVEKLGFPWILSSESSILNGLRWIFAERNFSRPFAPAP